MCEGNKDRKDEKDSREMSRNEMLENKDWNVYLTEQNSIHGIESLFRCFCHGERATFCYPLPIYLEHQPFSSTLINTCALCILISVPLYSIEALIGETVYLPCNISTQEINDDIELILWYREDKGTPIYR
jgi:hypothetical protein